MRACIHGATLILFARIGSQKRSKCDRTIQETVTAYNKVLAMSSILPRMRACVRTHARTQILRSNDAAALAESVTAWIGWLTGVLPWRLRPWTAEVVVELFRAVLVLYLKRASQAG